ncbi:hypothetical protein O2W14_18745 [Modestobacter sp. VKM Ac-2986]|uniref:hypothetical protein n=1 Tax=Modestobacter sp. VKM Ac-2986 TaxID=3004140 RepID=UPI0022ABA3E8|nr:hypothetical protein [Modestobacter sp. VKM Ac-2986]MCZ2830884.1 hypothetical protein [Modestobacter sp. VKM Ac-2986]
MKHSAPSLPRRRAVRLGLVLTPVLAVALGTSVIWQTSYAAFTATTTNGVNNWNSGGVTLVDDDGSNGGTGLAMFNVSNLKPGMSGEKCIVVTGGGSLAGEVKLYGTGYTTSKPGTADALAASIDLSITKGTGGSFGGGCGTFSPDPTTPNTFTGTLAAFSARNSYSTAGTTLWTTTPNADTSRTFKFNYTLKSDAPTGSQNGNASITFVWESQNTAP